MNDEGKAAYIVRIDTANVYIVLTGFSNSQFEVLHIQPYIYKPCYLINYISVQIYLCYCQFFLKKLKRTPLIDPLFFSDVNALTPYN